MLYLGQADHVIQSEWISVGLDGELNPYYWLFAHCPASPSPTQSVNTPYQCQAGGMLSRYYPSLLTTTPSVTAGIVIEL